MSLAKSIILVTSAAHMPRAASVFSYNNINIVPAPVGYHSGSDSGVPFYFNFLPSFGGLYGSRIFLHEIIGNIWYKLRIIVD